MRRLGTATAAAALLGSLAFGAAPANAALVDTCKITDLVCVLVLTDPGEGCPAGTQQVIGVPIPRTNQALVRVCVRM